MFTLLLFENHKRLMAVPPFPLQEHQRSCHRSRRKLTQLWFPALTNLWL